MPEGPEIAREADRIRAAIGGESVERVRFAFPSLSAAPPYLLTHGLRQ